MCDRLIYTMDYPDLIVLDFMGNFIGLLMIKLFLLVVLCASSEGTVLGRVLKYIIQIVC